MISAAPKPIAYRCHCGTAGAFGYLVDGGWQYFCAEHRLQKYSADACVSEAESAHAHAELVPDNAPPDLQELVAAHGGYSNIPATAWAQYDEAMKVWQAQRREKYRRR
jgi:hypothetical protein